ncbi:hypothetical protein [Porphyrobacter sp. AAP82]|uniref:hypothetical protein n=1 Tax=Porphyrobacter sp. AAP82 TaxID=1248917 RepID=UPI0002E7BD9E|nr:hypothetical protein [Porphyrobacter sp. AAP82]
MTGIRTTMTTARAFAFALPALALLLGACGSEPDKAANDADSFAARIGKGEATPGAGGVPVAQGTVAPTVAQPAPGAAPGVYSPGTLTDPKASTCGAPLAGPFIGKLADQPTRAEIAKVLGRTDNLRFVAFGSNASVNPDPTNPRLSIMLDAQNIIRDARCG